MSGMPDLPGRAPKDAPLNLQRYENAVTPVVRGVEIPTAAIPALARMGSLFSDSQRAVNALDAGRTGIAVGNRDLCTSRHALLTSLGQKELVTLGNSEAARRGNSPEGYPKISFPLPTEKVELPVDFAGEQIPKSAGLALADISNRYAHALLDEGRRTEPSDGVSSESWHALLVLTHQGELIIRGHLQAAQTEASVPPRARVIMRSFGDHRL